MRRRRPVRVRAVEEAAEADAGSGKLVVMEVAMLFILTLFFGIPGFIFR
jgi:hypothetical protein